MRIYLRRDYDMIGVTVQIRGFEIDLTFWNWNAKPPVQVDPDTDLVRCFNSEAS